jgi:hypothetical protein
MRHLLLVLFTVFIIQVNGQSFVTYKDTIHHFSINIPEKWKYGASKDAYGVVLAATRVPVGKADTARDNFNINIIQTPGKDLEKTFSSFMKYLPDGVQNYKLIDKGDITLNGIKLKWLIETHKNESADIQMHNYDFVAFKNGKTYILTLVTFSYYFDTIKPLFDKIASSFILND